MFALNNKLQDDSLLVCDLKISKLLLMNDANYLWLILVPCKENLVEMIDLSFEEQKILLLEINAVSEVLKKDFLADKLNIANLGNVVSQLHIHIIARYKNDLAFPNPVWNFAPAKPYENFAAKNLIQKLKLLISEQFEQLQKKHNEMQKILQTPIGETDILRKKIIYRANHRGCKETDFLLGKFFNEKLSEHNLEICSQFIEEDDLLIYDWILNKKTAPNIYQSLVSSIKNFHGC